MQFQGIQVASLNFIMTDDQDDIEFEVGILYYDKQTKRNTNEIIKT